METHYEIINKSNFEIVKENNFIVVDKNLAKTISILNKKGYYVEACNKASVSNSLLISNLINDLLTKNLLVIGDEAKKIIKKVDCETTFIIFKNKYNFKTLPKRFHLVSTDTESHLYFNLCALKKRNNIELKSLIELQKENEESLTDLEIWAKKLPNNVD